MTDKEIVERAKEAEKRTGFGELVHSPISKGVNSAYGIGFIEGMVEYRNSMQEKPVSEDLEVELKNYLNSDEYINTLGVSGYLLIARHFANWQKNKMMEDAVDGEVGYWNQRGLSVNMDLPRTLEEDDKVKLIIIKEDKV